MNIDVKSDLLPSKCNLRFEELPLKNRNYSELIRAFSDHQNCRSVVVKTLHFNDFSYMELRFSGIHRAQKSSWMWTLLTGNFSCLQSRSHAILLSMKVLV